MDLTDVWGRILLNFERSFVRPLIFIYCFISGNVYINNRHFRVLLFPTMLFGYIVTSRCVGNCYWFKVIEKHLKRNERQVYLPEKIVAISGLSLFLSMSITPGGKVSRFFSRKPVASYSTCGNPHRIRYQVQDFPLLFLPSLVWRTSNVVFGLSS